MVSVARGESGRATRAGESGCSEQVFSSKSLSEVLLLESSSHEAEAKKCLMQKTAELKKLAGHTTSSSGNELGRLQTTAGPFAPLGPSNGR